MKFPRRSFTAAIMLVVLGCVFYLYTLADFMVQMVNQVWACF